ncbi:MAG TPA: SMC-Scp complex subunit ScpB [Thermoanaerobaculia bacterium]|nr:SMC-Scp complex subunit ScpB [Thermoanaerobaculia bacterium]
MTLPAADPEALQLDAAVEAILFVTAEPVPVERILEAFTAGEREAAQAAIDRVLSRYRVSPDEQPGRGVVLDEVAGGVRLVTRPDLHGYLKKFFESTEGSRLSLAALETLAIVAYRQPITAPEIQDLRGRNSAGVLKTLLERRLARISGRKDVVGRPFLYSTTRDFLLHFGLRSIEELPPLEEFEESYLGGGDFSEEAGGKPADREEEVLQQLALVDDADDDADDDVEAGEDAEAREDPGDPEDPEEDPQP